jgi:hypothetical protein
LGLAIKRQSTSVAVTTSAKLPTRRAPGAKAKLLAAMPSSGSKMQVTLAPGSKAMLRKCSCPIMPQPMMP